MGKIIKANGPDYIAQEISLKVQYLQYSQGDGKFI